MENYNINPSDAWNGLGDASHQVSNYYDSEMEYNNFQAQTLEFHDTKNHPQQEGVPFMKMYEPQYPDILTPDFSQLNNPGDQGTEFDEPPLLEELEIYPDRIMEKTLAVLNPFRSYSLADDADFLSKESDLAGPIAFCLALAVCLFISGNKAPFGYIYGLSVLSCLFMYILLNLMTTNTAIFTLSSVASILGYCLLPIVGFSIIGVFIPLYGIIGIALALMTVFWSSLSASRLFIAMSGDKEQRPLIAYPCALVFGVFALLVLF